MSLNRYRHAALARRGTWLSCGLALSWGVGGVACDDYQSNPEPSYGGSAGSGGGAGAGGAGSGGTSGSAGASGGNAGTSGTGGGGSSTPTTVYDFNDSLEGFAITYYCLGPANSQNCSAVDAAPAPVADAGADAGDGADAGAAPAPANDFYSATQDPAVGDPGVGSAKIELDFTAGEQTAVFAINYAVGANLTGKTLTARVLVDAGAPATTSAKLYIKTGANFYYADRGALTLVPGTWLTLTYDMGLPPVYPTAPTAVYQLSVVREIGVEIGATAISTPALTVVHVDTIQY